MIFSSLDIYHALTSDSVIGTVAKVRIVDSRPSLTPEDGIAIYISKYPELSEFEAAWSLWLIDFDNEPLDIIINQIKRILPSFQLKEEGAIVYGVLTEIKTSKTDVPPAKPKEISIEPYLQSLREQFDELADSINDRMLLVNSGRPGRDGRDGKDGVPGRDGKDGKDLLATDAELNDLQDVFVDDAKKGDVLTYDGETWVAKFVEQRYSAGGAGLTNDEIVVIEGLMETAEPMGHSNRAESEITFDDETRTFTISPVGDSFRVWVKSKRFVIKEPRSIQIPDSTGLYYIYFDENGDLNYRTSFFHLDSEAPTSYIYWDAEDSVCPYLAEERHGIVLDWQTHEYLHRTRGASIANGFDIANYVLNGSGTSNSDAQFDIENGTFFDEDIRISIEHSETPVAGTFQQDLQGPAELPIVYRIGDIWKMDTATAFPVKMGTTHIVYNHLVSGSWTTTDVATNKYVNYYVIATNNHRGPVISLMGQETYANQTDAKNESFSADLVLTGFPSREFRFLYKITYQVGNHTNDVKAIVVAIQDLRYFTALPSALLA